jgi:hypothetical protein
MAVETRFRFRFSRPYEMTLAMNMGVTVTPEDIEKGHVRAEAANLVWREHEDKVMKLFEEMYKIKITETSRPIYVSQILSGAFSDPMTLSLKRFPDLEADENHKQGLVFLTIHELAHFFMFQRPADSFVNQLFQRAKKQKISDDRGTCLHFVVQAVEFGLGAEVFGSEAARARLLKKVSEGKGEYQASAILLQNHNVPLDKTCLEFIDKEVLKD